jgi:hypothetical protein
MQKYDQWLDMCPESLYNQMSFVRMVLTTLYIFHTVELETVIINRHGFVLCRSLGNNKPSGAGIESRKRSENPSMKNIQSTRYDVS